MPASNDQRFQMIGSAEWFAKLDAWRSRQEPAPTRAAAIRSLTERAMLLEGGGFASGGMAFTGDALALVGECGPETIVTQAKAAELRGRMLHVPLGDREIVIEIDERVDTPESVAAKLASEVLIKPLVDQITGMIATTFRMPKATHDALKAPPEKKASAANSFSMTINAGAASGAQVAAANAMMGKVMKKVQFGPTIAKPGERLIEKKRRKRL